MPPPGAGTCVKTSKRLKRSGRAIRYLRVTSGPQRGKYVHTLVAEALLGRELHPDEEVDHDDGDTMNNKWWNLKVKTTEQHAHDHRSRERAREGSQAEPLTLAPAYRMLPRPGGSREKTL